MSDIIATPATATPRRQLARASNGQNRPEAHRALMAAQDAEVDAAIISRAFHAVFTSGFYDVATIDELNALRALRDTYGEKFFAAERATIAAEKIMAEFPPLMFHSF